MRMEEDTWAAFQDLRGLLPPDQFHYLVGNVINSEHSRLNLVFQLGSIHVTIL